MNRDVSEVEAVVKGFTDSPIPGFEPTIVHAKSAAQAHELDPVGKCDEHPVLVDKSLNIPLEQLTLSEPSRVSPRLPKQRSLHGKLFWLSCQYHGLSSDCIKTDSYHRTCYLQEQAGTRCHA